MTRPRKHVSKYDARPPILQQMLGFSLLSLALLALSPFEASAAKTSSGYWTRPDSSKDLGGTAVHMVLMPSDSGEFHSSVLWWRGGHKHAVDQIDGGLMLWKPATEDTLGLWRQNFAFRPVPYPGSDIFCAGTVAVSSGDLAIIGGTEVGGGETGTQQARIFDHLTRNWTAAMPDSMAYKRWYPAVTAVDGKVFVSTGSMNFHVHTLGGIRPSVSAPDRDSLRRFRVVAAGGWEEPFKLDSGRWPTARDGHTLLHSQETGAQFMFGGRTANGSITDSTYRLFRNPNDLGSDYVYAWTPVVPVVRTDPRTQHAAVMIDKGTQVVHGGRGAPDGTGKILRDVARLGKSGTDDKWFDVDQDTSAFNPGPRYGHVAVYDTLRKRMLIFGGSATYGGAPVDNDVWEFKFNGARDAGVWKKVTVSGGDTAPSARSELAGFMDPVLRSRNGEPHDPLYQRAVFFGGRTGTSYTSGTSDLYALWIHNDTDGTVEWQHISPSGTAPAGRIQTALGWDPGTERL